MLRQEVILRALSAEVDIACSRRENTLSGSETRSMEMNFLNHSLNGYRIPLYIEEILTHNYCPCFMRMSMVREGESYKFSYRPGSLTRINPKGMDTYEKLLLVRSLITVKETAESYLISAEDYLFEPELVYTTDMSLSAQDLKILFYPDVRKLDFS